MSWWLGLGLLLAIGAIAAAAGPEACAPQENYAVCEIKVQRNVAHDLLANSEGKLRATQDYWEQYQAGAALQRVVLAEWWRQYAEGINGKAAKHVW